MVVGSGRVGLLYDYLVLVLCLNVVGVGSCIGMFLLL